jgi:hypothetical protein
MTSYKRVRVVAGYFGLDFIDSRFLRKERKKKKKFEQEGKEGRNENENVGLYTAPRTDFFTPGQIEVFIIIYYDII